MGSSAGRLVHCVADVLVHNGRAVELLSLLLIDVTSDVSLLELQSYI